MCCAGSATRWALFLATVAAVGLIGPTTAAGAAPKQDDVTLRLGYFPNVTHATALVGVESGLFEEKLGNDAQLEPSTFNAGPQVVEALNSDALDASYIGPNPAINAFAHSNGEAIRIVSGATSGGAFLVVKPSIKGAKDLKGKQIATPQLGNTQDVALRTWLKKKGYKTDTAGGGDVSVVRRRTGRLSTCSSRVRSTARGCPSRGQRDSSRRAVARSSSTSASCGPTVVTSPHT
jgi:NitT/TauT family transport system substrate-binding protein